MRSFWSILRAIACPILLGMMLICMLLVVIAVMITPEGMNPAQAIALKAYLIRYDNQLNSPLNTDAEARRFVVEQNDTAQDIGVNLVTQGFISNGTLFKQYVRYEGLDTKLRAGTFYIRSSMSIPEIARILTNPRPTTVHITLIEGWRMEQIAEVIDREPMLNFSGNDFLATVQSGSSMPLAFTTKYSIPAGRSLEGFLFPATYEVSIDATAVQFRDQILEAFENNVTQTMINQAAANGRTMYQVISLASIVEREAVIATERPQIASVYLNRIKDDIRLEADPTTQYGIGNTRDGNWWPQITADDYLMVNEYNTYVIEGLPPGPIANPSLSSIRAVLNPAETPYYFFRAACDGSGLHLFSITFEEHVEKGC